MQAVEQRLFEFPESHQMLVEGEQNGWTNFPPEAVTEMKSENIIITTNGVDVANPMILAKYAEKPRLRHAGLSQRTGWNHFAPAATRARVGVYFHQKTKAVYPFGRDCADNFSRRCGVCLVRFQTRLVAQHRRDRTFLLRLDWPKKFKFIAVAGIFGHRPRRFCHPLS